jgi:hypothetical protein
MKTIKLSAALFLLLLTCNATAASVYDGIYTTSPDVGYVIFKENQGTMLSIINTTYNGLDWAAAMGTLNTNTVRLNSIIGNTKLIIDITFTAENSYRATIISCIPNQGYYCSFPTGSTFTGYKIW